MKYYIAKLVFFVTGWKLETTAELIERAKNTVTVAAPHTSNQDFIFSLGAFWLMRLPLKFLIKDSYTKWYFLGFFTWLGGIGVSRIQRKNLVGYSVELLEMTDYNLMLAPEGTRKKVDKWKTGFYHIAKEAGVNISLGYLDYSLKRAGLLAVLSPDNLESTLGEIEAYYAPVKGKKPENYNLKIY
ncbi:MAG: 1-acyl-sn-glycerol-3-phosphate acyltransferase [Flavobacteriales bacterium]|jgi:1-acyl-sn-glycerol-3-phosphate acyltransferase|tara:strand:- start:3762 stop:4316 length:555 start_codon:yes stop_codon:yes gene_type:complete